MAVLCGLGGRSLSCWLTSRFATQLVAALISGCIILAAGPYSHAGAVEKKPQVKAEKPPARPPLPEQQSTGSLATQYCEAMRDVVAEARTAQLAAQMEALAKQMEERAAKLDEKNAQLKEWIDKRDAFSRKATQQLVSIFAAMRPESASEQLVRLDPPTAASILLQLDARTASAILNDMPAAKAAKLAAIIADTARKDETAVQR